MRAILGWIVLIISFAVYPLLGTLIVEYHTVGYGLHHNVAAALAVLWAVLQYMLSTWIDDVEPACYRELEC